LKYQALQRWLPNPVLRYVLHFEAAIVDAVTAFAATLPADARMLDAGAGEGPYAHHFHKQRYVGVDLGVGDAQWNYSKLDAVADLTTMPFAAGSFDACTNIVTLEHVREPGCVLAEIERVLKPGGRLLLVVPHEWEVHQSPHDYFRYTRHGVKYLLDEAGFADFEIEPVGGYFRLLARRLLNGLQFFPGPFFLLAAIFVVLPALVIPWFDWLDRDRNFTLGYICIARKRS
jgi:SAM-dependent methyltransferase